MGSGLKSVSAIGVGGMNPEEAHLEALYNEEVNFFQINDEVSIKSIQGPAGIQV